MPSFSLWNVNIYVFSQQLIVTNHHFWSIGTVLTWLSPVQSQPLIMNGSQCSPSLPNSPVLLYWYDKTGHMCTFLKCGCFTHILPASNTLFDTRINSMLYWHCIVYMKSSFPKRDKRQIKKKWVRHAILLSTEPITAPSMFHAKSLYFLI